MPDNQTTGESERKTANYFAIASYVLGAICMAIAAYIHHLLMFPGNDLMLRRLLTLEEVLIPCLGASILMMLFRDFKYVGILANEMATAIHEANEFIAKTKRQIKFLRGIKKDNTYD